MRQRDRFIKYMNFEPVDRIPLMEMGVWPETLQRWHGEGLPRWVRELRHLEDYLDLDLSFNLNWLPINHEFYPRFEEEVLEETDQWELIRDEDGIICRRLKKGRSIPQYVRFPVETEANYQALRSRLDGSEPRRYSDDFDEDVHWRRNRGEIIGINFRSFFGFHRNLMGLESWSVAFYDQPELVRQMISDRLQFGKELFARVLSTGFVDFVQIWEDMAYKTASMISPRLVRETMSSAYAELVAYLREGGVQLIMVDSDGRVDDLLPIFLEAGIDGIHPCEMAAGSDPIALRRKFPGCRLIGGLDKRLIATGREGVDAELKRVQPLLKEGGYIPMLDHYVPPDVSYETYCYYVERRRELLSQ